LRASTRQPQGDVIEYKDFLGISNAKDITRVPKGYLLRAVNFDVDVEMMLHRRRGYKSFLPVGAHSLWSNEFFCFFISGKDLYRLKDDWTYSIILAGVGDNRMEYIDVNGIVYFTNNQFIGYIQDENAYAFPEVTETYKTKMIGGQLLEFYNSRLYTAQDETIFYSDAGRPMVMDERHNFIQCSGRVRMIKSVVDGLYISEGEHVFFYYGDGKEDPPKFKRIPIIDVPCFEGMAIKIEGEEISPKIASVVVVWPGEEGVFMGMPGGKFYTLTGRNFFLEGVSHGSSTFISRSLPRGYSAFPQFLGVYDMLPGFGEGEVSLELPIMIIYGTGVAGSQILLGEELLINGNMESWDDPVTLSAPWIPWVQGGATVNRESVEKVGGNYSCRLDVGEYNADPYLTSFAAIYQFPAFNLTPGKKYRFSFWYKMSVTDKELSFTFVDDTDTVGLQLDGTWGNSTPHNLPNKTSWTLFSLDFYPHPSYTPYAIQFDSNDSSEFSLYLDSISVKEIL
jgi:hypothetical protein